MMDGGSSTRDSLAPPPTYVVIGYRVRGLLPPPRRNVVNAASQTGAAIVPRPSGRRHRPRRLCSLPRRCVMRNCARALRPNPWPLALCFGLDATLLEEIGELADGRTATASLDLVVVEADNDARVAWQQQEEEGAGESAQHTRARTTGWGFVTVSSRGWGEAGRCGRAVEGAPLRSRGSRRSRHPARQGRRGSFGPTGERRERVRGRMRACARAPSHRQKTTPVAPFFT